MNKIDIKHYSIVCHGHDFRVYEFGHDEILVSIDRCLGLKFVRHPSGGIAFYKWIDHAWKPRYKFDTPFDRIKDQQDILNFIKAQDKSKWE